MVDQGRRDAAPSVDRHVLGLAEIARPVWAALGPQANQKRPLTVEEDGRCLRRAGPYAGS